MDEDILNKRGRTVNFKNRINPIQALLLALVVVWGLALVAQQAFKMWDQHKIDEIKKVKRGLLDGSVEIGLNDNTTLANVHFNSTIDEPYGIIWVEPGACLDGQTEVFDRAIELARSGEEVHLFPDGRLVVIGELEEKYEPSPLEVQSEELMYNMRPADER